MIWPLTRRLPRTAALVVRRAPSRIVLSAAARELLTYWPGASIMDDNVDLNPAMLHLTEKYQADRAALQHLLDIDPLNFAEQNRLLAEFQSGVRGVSILHRNVELVVAAPEPQAQIPLSTVLDRATKALDQQATEAVGTALGVEAG